jgi:hypothetical protein
MKSPSENHRTLLVTVEVISISPRVIGDKRTLQEINTPGWIERYGPRCDMDEIQLQNVQI